MRLMLPKTLEALPRSRRVSWQAHAVAVAMATLAAVNVSAVSSQLKQAKPSAEELHSMQLLRPGGCQFSPKPQIGAKLDPHDCGQHRLQDQHRLLPSPLSSCC
jgi:hypothetical protein